MKYMQKVLTAAQTQELSDWQLALLRKRGYMPAIAGGAPDGEGEGEGESDAESQSGGEPADEDESGKPAGDEDDDEPTGDRTVELRGDEQVVSRSEFERVKRVAGEAEAKAKKAEREAARRAEQEKREAGNWEELIRERDERILEMEAERDAARLELDETLRTQRIAKAATKLGFRDPVDARFFLSEDETQDDPATERALKRLMREKPYLVNERRPSAAPANGDGPTLTIEEIKRMKPEEVNARWQEVQDRLAAAGGRN